MCELFALSSQLPTRVTFSLEEFAQHGGNTGPHTDGWGLAFYDGSDAQLFREPQPAATSEWMNFLLRHQYRSRCVVSHIRHATEGEIALRNTQPFSRMVKGKRHVFCHNGYFHGIRHSLQPRHFLPIGETDSEYGFCWLMDKIGKLWQAGTPSLEARIDTLNNALVKLARLGPANILYSDSDYLYAFANRRTQINKRIEPPGMHYLERFCESDPEALQNSGLQIDVMEQKIVLFASVPLSAEQWKPVLTDQLIVARKGQIVWCNQVQ